MEGMLVAESLQYITIGFSDMLRFVKSLTVCINYDIRR